MLLNAINNLSDVIKQQPGSDGEPIRVIVDSVSGDIGVRVVNTQDLVPPSSDAIVQAIKNANKSINQQLSQTMNVNVRNGAEFSVSAASIANAISNAGITVAL